MPYCLHFHMYSVAGGKMFLTSIESDIISRNIIIMFQLLFFFSNRFPNVSIWIVKNWENKAITRMKIALGRPYLMHRISAPSLSQYKNPTREMMHISNSYYNYYPLGRVRSATISRGLWQDIYKDLQVEFPWTFGHAQWSFGYVLGREGKGFQFYVDLV